MKKQQQQALVRKLSGTIYYVLDAQGKSPWMNGRRRQAGELAPQLGGTMSVYEYASNDQTQTLTFEQTEKHIYGSSRLGVNTQHLPLFGTQNNTYSMSVISHHIGERSYELSNHLGNVLSVISDKVIPHQNGGYIDYWLADLRHAQDYSPFGVTLNGRDLSLNTIGNKPYRYGYQGSEMDSEVKGSGNSYTTEFRQLDPRLGRWLSLDPVFQPHQSPYNSMDDNPIWHNDPLGDYTKKRAERLAKNGTKHGYKTKVVEKPSDQGNFGVYYEKMKGDTKHFETYFEGKFKGARKTILMVDMEDLTFLGSELLYDMVNCFYSKDWVFEPSGKVTLGAQAGINGTWGLVKFDVKANLISTELASGSVDITELGSGKNNYYTGLYIGKDSKIYLNQGVQAEVSLLEMVTVGAFGERQFYTYTGMEGAYGDSYNTGLYFFKPIFTKATGNFIKKKGLQPIKDVGALSSPKTKIKNKAAGTFHGYDFGIGASLIIGVNVSIKVGYND
jgi:RHS repeat-associated protein